MISTIGIAFRLWLWAGMIRVLKRIVPVGTLVRLAHRKTRRLNFAPGGGESRERFEERLRTYLESRGRFPFRPPSNCLERSLGAYRLLCSAAADPQLVIGVRRSVEGVEGHVWVTSRGRLLAEAPADLAPFTTIVTFDADARQRTAAGFEGALSAMRVP